jgi:hypothetical protein
MNLLVFLGGLILLVTGANTLVRGASKLALSFGTCWAPACCCWRSRWTASPGRGS